MYFMIDVWNYIAIIFHVLVHFEIWGFFSFHNFFLFISFEEKHLADIVWGPQSVGI